MDGSEGGKDYSTNVGITWCTDVTDIFTVCGIAIG